MNSPPAREIAAKLTYWSSPVDPKPLGGGTTNTNFVVEDADQLFVVRVGEDIPLHGIARAQEVAACQAAFRCGLSPEIVHHEPGAMVMRFIQAKTLTKTDVQDPATLSRIVDLLLRCHADMPGQLQGPSLMFWVFQVNRQYLAALTQSGCRLEHRLAGLHDMNTQLETRLGPIQPTFCHNDLLPANILDDGSRLWLLDWEYAGWNTAMFDLANLAANAEFTTGQSDHLLEEYFGAPPDSPQLDSFAVLGSASLLREGLWSLIQEQHSTLDFDFETYTDTQLTHLEVARQNLQLHSHRERT